MQMFLVTILCSAWGFKALALNLGWALIATRPLIWQLKRSLSKQIDFNFDFHCCMNIFENHCNFYFSDSTDRIEMMSPAVSDVYYTLLPFLYGLTHVSKVGSVFTTLAVSLERYFAVCKPLWIRIRRCHPAMYIILVTVFAFAFNIPKFLEFEVNMTILFIKITKVLEFILFLLHTS